MARFEEEEEDRGGWDNKLDFLFSCISVSVGLGSEWLWSGHVILIVMSIWLSCHCSCPVNLVACHYNCHVILIIMSIWLSCHYNCHVILAAISLQMSGDFHTCATRMAVARFS